MVRAAQDIVHRNSTGGITRFSVEDETARLCVVRFFEKVEPVKSGCWLWRAGTDDSGYGRFALNRSPRKAHRVVWELFNGPIPGGQQVHHLCHVRHCVNFVSHLELMGVSEHSLLHNPHRDKTHCPQGHAYDAANVLVRVDARGYEHRHCRACNTARAREWRERRRARVLA